MFYMFFQNDAYKKKLVSHVTIFIFMKDSMWLQYYHKCSSLIYTYKYTYKYT